MTGTGNPQDGTLVARVRITNQKGLHARAAAKFVKISGSFGADIRVAKGEMDVSGGSIMGLMMLAAGIGSELELRASGADAQAAIDALLTLIERKFDEE
jgi:phosphocarrier protein